MELQFSINSTHSVAKHIELLNSEMQKHDLMIAQRRNKLLGGPSRFAKALLFFSPATSFLALIYFSILKLNAESIIAFIIVSVIFYLLWHRYSNSFLNRSPKASLFIFDQFSKALRAGYKPLLSSILRTKLKVAEGSYRLLIEDQRFTLISHKGTRAQLAWSQIVYLKETPDAYKVACAKLLKKGLAYQIPKHSDIMDAEQYKEGLQLFLHKCPIAPEQNPANLAL
ncbi:MAG: YcxB family protein [Proteobacteria bacterium]|nr:YcxB family protein [Pseudomonadota bacterium]